jgi:SAM-dependent methyltransferase
MASKRSGRRQGYPSILTVAYTCVSWRGAGAVPAKSRRDNETLINATDTLAAFGHFAEIDEAIFALDGRVAEPTHYDRMGAIYDRVCGTRLYNYVVWGTTPTRSRSFASRVFESRARGPHVEVGCGGLLFTSHVYDVDRGRPCILTDPSVSMLRIARERLRRRHGRVPDHVALVRADGFALPLPAGFAATVLSMHVLHVLEERAAFLEALSSLAAPEASTVGLTSLVHTRTFRDRFISALHRAGELASPLTADDLGRIARRSLTGTIDIERHGEMSFVTAARH